MLEIPKVNAIHTESAAAIRSDFIILILLVKPSAGSFYSIPASAVNALLLAAITSRLGNGDELLPNGLGRSRTRP